MPSGFIFTARSFLQRDLERRIQELERENRSYYRRGSYGSGYNRGYDYGYDGRYDSYSGRSRRYGTPPGFYDRSDSISYYNRDGYNSGYGNYNSGYGSYNSGYGGRYGYDGRYGYGSSYGSSYGRDGYGYG